MPGILLICFPKTCPTPPHSMAMAEHKIQAQLISYLKFAGYWDRYPIFAVPNGIWIPAKNATLRSKIANRMRAEGMRPGASDLIFLIPRGGYHGMVLELKRDDGGSGASDEQLEFIKLAEQQGYFAAIPIGYEDAQSIVDTYLSWGTVKSVLDTG